MDIFLLVLRLVLFAVFATSAIAKLADRAGSAKAMRDFGVPGPLAIAAWLLLAVAELAIAAGLLFTSSSWHSALAAASLLVIFIAVMMYQYARGNAPDCHCFGQLHSEPVGLTSIIRNIILLIPAGILSVQGREAQGYSLVNSSQDALIVGASAALAGLLVLALVLLKSLSNAQAEIIRRIEILEIGGGVSPAEERENIGHPREGLPLGALVRAFSLPDLEGNQVALSDLSKDGRAVLFFFISPTCGPCKALLPAIEEWEKEFAAQLRFVYISDGTPEANRKKLRSVDGKTILLQEKREVVELFRAKWTPMAVLMNTRGRIASFTAAGDEGLRRLVDELRGGNVLDPAAVFPGKDYRTLTPLRIGERVPALEARDIEGNKFSSGMIKGRETLFAFWSSSCPHCVAMMEQIKEWDATRNGTDPEMVLFVHAKEDEAAQLGLKLRVIVDRDLELGGELGQHGTPSAILVDENGQYISETAIGAEDIWALVGKRF